MPTPILTLRIRLSMRFQGFLTAIWPRCDQSPSNSRRTRLDLDYVKLVQTTTPRRPASHPRLTVLLAAQPVWPPAPALPQGLSGGRSRLEKKARWICQISGPEVTKHPIAAYPCYPNASNYQGEPAVPSCAVVRKDRQVNLLASTSKHLLVTSALAMLAAASTASAGVAPTAEYELSFDPSAAPWTARHRTFF